MSLVHRDENVTEEKLEEISKKVEFLIERAQKEVFYLINVMSLNLLSIGSRSYRSGTVNSESFSIQYTHM